MKRLLIAATALSLVAGASHAAPAKWVPVWAAPPTPTNAQSKSYENQTILQVVRVSAGGKRVRVRISNEYGAKPLVIGAASVGLAPGGKAAGPKTALTFNGKAGVTIPPNAPIWSDPVDLPVKALDSLSVSLFFPQNTGPCTCHLTGAQTGFVSAAGDFTKAEDFKAASTFINRAFVTEVDVQPAANLPVLITFGDSITDGYNSTVDGNHRWPDVLAERLKGKVAIAPKAISGNQIRGMGQAMFGESALTRLDRDLLSVPDVKWVVVLEGINDLGMNRGSARPGLEEMITGYRQIVDRAHAHGMKVYGATLLPYEGAAYFSPEGEATRKQINAWMRSKDSAFDGLIDFDKVMADPAHPTKMRPEQQSGDWLHPNDAGYKVMGEAVDLKLFR